MYQKSSIVVRAQELCEQRDRSGLSVPIPFQSLFQSLINHTVSVDVKQLERIIVALYRHQKYNTHTHRTPAVHTIHFSPQPPQPPPHPYSIPPANPAFFFFLLFFPPFPSSKRTAVIHTTENSRVWGRDCLMLKTTRINRDTFFSSDHAQVSSKITKCDLPVCKTSRIVKPRKA